jgi:PAS domain S-box-containing protein
MTISDALVPYEDSPEAVLLETLGGRVLDCNLAALNIFGYTREEVPGLTVFDLVPIEIAKRIPDFIVEQIQAGELEVEAIGVRKNGERFRTLVTTRVITIDEDKYVLARVADLTADET